jgi:hypothetical protein
MDKKRIGIVCICLNPPYWQFGNEMLWGLNTFFLKHPSIKEKYDVKLLLWSDISEESEQISLKLAEYLASRNEIQTSIVNQTQLQFIVNDDKKVSVEALISGVVDIRKLGVTIFPTEPVEWPLPTLLRYNLFLQQEEKLKDFDYIFYIDCDMRITDWIGEEILGEGLTAAVHPMYFLKENLYPPYDPNPLSEAYIRFPGSYIDDGKGGKKFRPEYYAGGFQGGKTEVWIQAMKEMKGMIEKDFNNNYIPRWNDESIFNSYVFRHPEISKIVLDPSYIYPDSLIAEYYVKHVWGRNYSPKIMTLTKSFSTTKEGGEAVRKLNAL